MQKSGQLLVIKICKVFTSVVFLKFNTTISPHCRSYPGDTTQEENDSRWLDPLRSSHSLCLSLTYALCIFITPLSLAIYIFAILSILYRSLISLAPSFPFFSPPTFSQSFSLSSLFLPLSPPFSPCQASPPSTPFLWSVWFESQLSQDLLTRSNPLPHCCVQDYSICVCLGEVPSD